jgi:hypothetical protein
MNKNQIRSPGLYLYKLPQWDKPVEVEVEKDNEGKLLVRFSNYHYPVKMNDIPSQAIFEPDWR